MEIFTLLETLEEILEQSKKLPFTDKAVVDKEAILEVIKEMVSQVGEPQFKDGIIQKGVIVRHLLLPGLLFDSKKVIDTLYNNFGDNIYISFMNQYTPLYNAKNYPEINKPINPKIYDSLINYAVNIGVKNGFIQEEGTNSENYVPSFKNEGVKSIDS